MSKALKFILLIVVIVVVIVLARKNWGITTNNRSGTNKRTGTNPYATLENEILNVATQNSWTVLPLIKSNVQAYNPYWITIRDNSDRIVKQILNTDMSYEQLKNAGLLYARIVITNAQNVMNNATAMDWIRPANEIIQRTNRLLTLSR